VTNSFRILFTVTFVTVLYACAMPQVMESVEAPRANEIIVFGSVELFHDDKKKKWGMTWEGDRYCIFPVLPPVVSESVCYKVGKDGSFYWSLVPGEHILLGAQIHKGADFSQMRTRYSLIVPDGVDAVYVGKLQIHRKDYRYATRLVDDYVNAIGLFDSKYKIQDAKIINRPLVVEDSPGEYGYMSSQCKGKEYWGVECKWGKPGIEAVNPPIKKVHFSKNHLFPEVEDVLPMFEWESSGKNEISYDLVIYEATRCVVTGITTSYMPGRLVAYIEDIKTPHYKLTNALKPDTKYLWTVRMRDENTVTNWSKFHYADNSNILFMSSVYGSYFGFKTP